MTKQLLTLKHSELLALLHLSGAQGMNGLGWAVFSAMDDTRRNHVVSEGIARLLTRDLFRLKDSDRLVFDESLRDLILTCLFPEAVLMFARTQPDQSTTTVFFSATERGAVEYAPTGPDEFVFTPLPSAEALRAEVRRLVSPVGPVTNDSSEPFPISADVLTEVLQASRAGRFEAARAALRDAGWPAEHTDAMPEDCHEAVVWTGVSAWALDDHGTTNTTSLMVIAGSRRCWHIEPRAETNTLTARVASQAECERTLLALAEPHTSVLDAQNTVDH